MRSQGFLAPKFLLAAACVQAACAAPLGTPAPVTAIHGRSDANIELAGVAVDRLVDARVAASGTAAALTYVRAGGRFEATQVHAVLREHPGSAPASGLAGAPVGEVTLSAPRVTGELDARHARAEGGVTIRTGRGDRLDTDHAEFDGAAGLVRADAQVLLSGPGYQTRAASGTARTDGTQVELRGAVSGELTPEARATPLPKPEQPARPKKKGRR